MIECRDYSSAIPFFMFLLFVALLICISIGNVGQWGVASAQDDVALMRAPAMAKVLTCTFLAMALAQIEMCHPETQLFGQPASWLCFLCLFQFDMFDVVKLCKVCIKRVLAFDL